MGNRRIRSYRLSLAGLSAVLLLGFTPLEATADPARRGAHDHRRGCHHAVHERQVTAGHPRADRLYERHRRQRQVQRRPAHHAEPFRCGPCQRRYGSWRGFTRHLRHHHQARMGDVPLVVLHTGLGWIF